MKVTHDDVIQSGEQELIDGITADLDWNAVENLFIAEHRLPIGDDVSYKNGDLVVHEGRIAYLLEFEVKVPVSILLDRQGHCIEIQSTTTGHDQDLDAIAGETLEADSEAPNEQARTDPGEIEGYEQTLSSIFEDDTEAAAGVQEDTPGDEATDAGIARMADEAQGVFSEMGKPEEA